MNQIKNIDDCYNPSHDETARQGYISLMRKFKSIMSDYVHIHKKHSMSNSQLRHQTTIN